METSYAWPVVWFSKPLIWLFPDLTVEHINHLVFKFNICNVLFCYCIPFFYVFYPTFLMPAIFLRFLSFVLGWAHGLLRHHPSHRLSHRPRPDIRQRPSFQTWLQRCSICLDQTYALCLENCRDQFCQACFARYVEEVVQQSWGLSVTSIKCPVCAQAIPQSEWSRYVSPLAVEKYNHYNQPYRPFSRYCTECEAPVTACSPPPPPSSSCVHGMSQKDRLTTITHALKSLMMSVPADIQPYLKECQGILEETCGKDYVSKPKDLQSLHSKVVPLLSRAALLFPRHYQSLASISKQLVTLQEAPEAWKQAQFMHISHFSSESCTQCHQEICMQCGENGHANKTCIEHLWIRSSQVEAMEKATLEWKLSHTQPCPNCSVLIHREEGCNKVDCLLCGFHFCWSCRSAWSQACGFYHCQTKVIGNTCANTELGVPDIKAIEAMYPSYDS